MADLLATRRACFLALLLLSAVAANACLRATKPALPKVFPTTAALPSKDKPPLILIPGILGSALVNAKTGERLWPELLPQDRDGLLLPIDAETLAANRDDVVAARVLENADLCRLAPQIGVYAELLKALESYGGYRRGDFDQPPANGDRDTYYLFAYDWRRDNVEAARLLAKRINRLKARLDKPDLRFDLIAHSMGGLVARYFAMYGERDVLGEPAPQPSWAGAPAINRLILIGAPNAGSFDSFRSLIQGYSVTEAHRARLPLFRGLHRRMIFTAPAVYQLLPRNEGAHFFDEQLRRLPLDLFELETWRRLGWSAAFQPDIAAAEHKAFVKKLGPAFPAPRW
jgi:pimeloyl-ACP methyl ester carboxylesterase